MNDEQDPKGARAVPWWAWTPLAPAVLYLILLAAQFNEIVTNVYLNADAASAPVIGSLAGHASGQIILGDLPWYSTLLFELTTRGLPLHRQLWELAPYAMALASIAIVAAALWRVAGRWAALLAAALLVCASPELLGYLFSLNDHSPTWFTLALLGGWAVVLQHCAGAGALRGRGVALFVAGGVLIGFVAGLNAASDQLVLIGGLIPLALAGAASWALVPGRATLLAGLGMLGTVVFAGAIAVITVHAMHNHEVLYSGHFAFGSQERVQGNLTLWWQSLAVLANGNFFGSAITLIAVLAAGCAVLVLAGVVGALRVGWLEFDADADADAHEPVRVVHVAYWTLAGLLVSGAYVFSSAPADLSSGRYLVGVLYAVAALLPLLALGRPRVRAALVAGALVYCVTGTIAMAEKKLTENTNDFPTTAIAGQVAAFAAREHVTRGYAGYWDAAPITWASHLRVHVYPVDSCPTGLCEFYLHTVASWYRVHPGERTFVLTDWRQPFLNTLPTQLGAPVASMSIGQVTMYVYSYDVASHIGPPNL